MIKINIKIKKMKKRANKKRREQVRKKESN